MFGIHKMSPLLLRINLSQIFTIYDIQALQKLSEDFQENILSGVILVYNRYSEQPICNLTKRRTLPPVFSGEIFENRGLWTAASKQYKRKISKKTFLVESFWYIISTLSSQSVIGPKEGLYHRYFPEKFSKMDKWTAASEQSKIAACNVIRFLTINFFFGILL